jgi:tRNA-2-methylthio-N6-dimethylallyladenosine synthase
MVEGYNQATGQWIGRTSQNRVLNFSGPPAEAPLAGRYLAVRVTRAGPNSLAGESANLL